MRITTVCTINSSHLRKLCFRYIMRYGLISSVAYLLCRVCDTWTTILDCDSVWTVIYHQFYLSNFHFRWVTFGDWMFTGIIPGFGVTGFVWCIMVWFASAQKRVGMLFSITHLLLMAIHPLRILLLVLVLEICKSSLLVNSHSRMGSLFQNWALWKWDSFTGGSHLPGLNRVSVAISYPRCRSFLVFGFSNLWFSDW